MPLLASDDGDPVGALAVYNSVSHPGQLAASDWDRKVLTFLAHNAALAVQNANRQEALRRAREQQAAAETFAAVGDIAANLLHRLNNKMGTIPVRVEGIQDKCQQLLAGDDYLARNLAEIERSAVEAMEVMRDSLFFLRSQDLAPVEIAGAVASAVSEAGLPPAVRVQVEGLEQLPPVLAGQKRLALVFMNLLENAAVAMAGVGEVRIQGAVWPGWVEVAVSDTGPGIAPALHDKIFELNYSGAKRTSGKLGFGLWWVKTLMARFGGAISVESDGHSGATFLLRFPLESSLAQLGQPRPMVPPSGSHNPAQRALLVEDDRSWQQILVELLGDAGFIVDVVDSYAAAVACLRMASHRLAVVDLALSGSDHHNQDGLRVLDAVRRQDPACVAILLSGYATVELAVSALKEYGAHTCLRKERFRRAEFRKLLQEALAAPPAAEEDAEVSTAELAQGTGASTAGSGAQVLVVEDDAGWRSILEELLAEAGYRVRLCSSYGEALGHLRRQSYALAVVDLSLASSLSAGGNVDGYRLLSSLASAGCRPSWSAAPPHPPTPTAPIATMAPSPSWRSRLSTVARSARPWRRRWRRARCLAPTWSR